MRLWCDANLAQHRQEKQLLYAGSQPHRGPLANAAGFHLHMLFFSRCFSAPWCSSNFSYFQYCFLMQKKNWNKIMAGSLAGVRWCQHNIDVPSKHPAVNQRTVLACVWYTHIHDMHLSPCDVICGLLKENNKLQLRLFTSLWEFTNYHWTSEQNILLHTHKHMLGIDLHVYNWNTSPFTPASMMVSWPLPRSLPRPQCLKRASPSL